MEIEKIKGGLEIKYKGQSISCFGDPEPTNNIYICCDGELYDGVYLDGFETWEECVKEIVDNHSKSFPNPVQIEVI